MMLILNLLTRMMAKQIDDVKTAIWVILLIIFLVVFFSMKKKTRIAIFSIIFFGGLIIWLVSLL